MRFFVITKELLVKLKLYANVHKIRNKLVDDYLFYIELQFFNTKLLTDEYKLQNTFKKKGV